jgi:hypothetical protein
VKTLKELTSENGHKILHHTQCTDTTHKYIKPFDYSVKHGGTVDSFKYYNDFYIDIGKNTEF